MRPTHLIRAKLFLNKVLDFNAPDLIFLQRTDKKPKILL